MMYQNMIMWCNTTLHKIWMNENIKVSWSRTPLSKVVCSQDGRKLNEIFQRFAETYFHPFLGTWWKFSSSMFSSSQSEWNSCFLGILFVGHLVTRDRPDQEQIGWTKTKRRNLRTKAIAVGIIYQVCHVSAKTGMKTFFQWLNMFSMFA